MVSDPLPPPCPLPPCPPGASTADPSKYCTLLGVALSFISTFFAHGFNSLAKKVSSGQGVSRDWVVANLLRNSALNLWGIGLTIIGLQVRRGGGAAVP